KIEKIAYGIGEIHGAEVEDHYEIPIGSVINNPIVTQYVKQSAQKLLGEEALMEEEFLFMGGDDFSSFSENVPSCYFFTGVGNKEKDCIYPIHNCKFNLDEDCLYQTVAILAQVSIDYLEDKKRRGK
ncbi:MAG: M20/M25/M40 family metallo-hydrolase, partial [Clostridiales bacterium]|nr:M20/M25/M40 family metallo-hydrolase [Clostridiales bacterium]